MVPARIKRQRGFALIAVVGVVLIICLVALAKFAMQDSERKLNRQTAIAIKLAKIDDALANFVAKNKRLPCPADGTIASGVLNAGLEKPTPATGICNPANQRNGVVPWITLGLSENDATDPWNGRISYRLDPQLAGTVPLLMTMSACDLAGTGSVGPGGACRTPVPTCIANPNTCTPPKTFLLGKGLDVWDGNGGGVGWAARINNPSVGTGAAYVLISHGPTGAGAYNSNGIYQPGSIGAIPRIPPPGTQAAGDNELPNLNNQALALPALQATTYRDAAFDRSGTVTNFDDYLSHPMIQTVLDKAYLGARVH